MNSDDNLEGPAPKVTRVERSSADTHKTVRWDPEKGAPPIIAEIDGGSRRQVFHTTFRIGRADDCDVQLESEAVSRHHAEVFWANGSWRVRDLRSTNGTYLEGLQVEVARLGPRNGLRLGSKGPMVWLTAEGAEERVDAEPSVSQYIRHYVEGDADDDATGHTRMIRLAVAKVSGRQRTRHLLQLATVTFVLVGAVVAVWQYRAAQIRGHHEAAQEIFYSMKELELRLARLEQQLDPSASLEEDRTHLRELSTSYDRYLEELGVLDEKTPEPRRLVLRIARVFGECEAAMPPELAEEVERYIAMWQADTRLSKAMSRVREGAFVEPMIAAFDHHNLPPQYFYIALQESDFRLDACGPRTRYGIAKGPWQFIPGTARAYGLKIGPLYRQRRSDPEDERHDLELASEAAARYVRDIYLREAEGSGLLVLAIYNYGGSNVRRLIRSLPEGPRERNFWRILIDHKEEFPGETYDYVMRVFSAAVIGENPQLFGFSFANPLEEIGESS